jgi:hypothetical protein
VTTKTRNADEAAPVAADDNLDELRARIARIEKRNNNIEAVGKLARHAATLEESRHGYIEDVDAADAQCVAVEAALAQVAANPKSTLEDLFRAYVPPLCADGRRNAIAAETAAQLEMADPLPNNPLSAAYQSRRPRYERQHKGMSFTQFVDQVVERWVTGEMVTARAEWLGRLTKIQDAAEQQARNAAKHQRRPHRRRRTRIVHRPLRGRRCPTRRRRDAPAGAAANVRRRGRRQAADHRLTH